MQTELWERLPTAAQDACFALAVGLTLLLSLLH